ncbi:MAG: TlpA family protein disulfide reductase [Bacteroidota bacterium]|jgi:thiol-disulfide isomerase/thioredoxin
MKNEVIHWYNKKYFGFLNLERMLWIALIGFGLFYYFRYQTVTEIETADIQLLDANGTTVSLNQLIADRPTVVHFYASWCGPCLQELPSMSEFAHSTDGKDVNWILITEDNLEKTNTFRARYAMNIFQVTRLKEHGIHSIPVTYVYNHSKLVYSHLGPLHWNDSNWQNEFKNYLK